MPDTIRRGILHELVPLVILLGFVATMGWFILSELHDAQADREQLASSLKRVEVALLVLQRQVYEATH